MALPRLAFAAGLLMVALVAAPAQAIYLYTPLTLSTGSGQANVGDSLDFSIDATDEDGQALWAGRNVIVRYVYNPAQGTETEAEAEAQMTTATILESLALNEKAHGSFTWQVPAEVDDLNVQVRLQDEAGEILGQYDLAIGDAPQVYTLASGGPGQEYASGPVVVDDEAPQDVPDSASDAEQRSDGAAKARDVPSVGVLALVGAAAAVALLARRRA